MASIVPDGPLQCGLQLPIQAQSKIFVEPWEEGAGRDELEAVVRKADAGGFFYVAVCDHVAVPKPFDESMQTTWYDPIATLGWVAALTTNVRILSHVLVAPYRHPLVAAKAFMTLDALSGGRVIVGIGTGHVEKEFEALGADFHRRGAITDEVIDVLRAAFSSEFPHSDGDEFPVADVGLRPRPVQEAIPIWVGGSSPAAMRRAAERGDGWLPMATARTEMPAAIASIREQRAAAGREDPVDIGALGGAFYVGQPDWEVGAHTVTGSAEGIAERLRELADMGVAHALVRPRSRSLDEFCDQMEEFANSVVPLLG